MQNSLGGLAKLVLHTLVFLSRGSNLSGEFVDGTMCVCFILVDWHWVVEYSLIPHKGRVLFPHDALVNDPTQAMDLNVSDCTTSGPSLDSPVTGKGGQRS